MTYAVIDTNVFVSGLINRRGSPAMIIRLIETGEITPVVSDAILNEIISVLSYKKFGFSRSDTDKIAAFLRKKIIPIKDMPPVNGIPEDDMKFASAALYSGCGILITGNRRHFKGIEDKVSVLSPDEFLLKYGY